MSESGGKCMEYNKTQKRKVQIITILTLFVFLADIYLIIYVPADYILATAAFVTFVFSILTISNWFRLKDLENKRREEQFADIVKSEKSEYDATLEMIKELDNKINFIGQKIMPLGRVGNENQRKIASMLDSIVQDQKKIAKITISRSKENADALMNSNDQLLVQMTAFRNTMEVIQEQISKQSEAGGKGNEGFGEIKDELFEKMQELTESIKKEVDEISENIEMSNQSVENLISTNRPVIQEKAVATTEPMVQRAMEEPVVPKSIQEEIVQEMAPAKQPVMQEAVKEVEPAMPQIAAPGIAAPEIPEPVKEAEPVIPETIEIEGNDVISELLMEKKPLSESVVSNEPKHEQPVKKPDMSDPNRPMSPEDIAALIANTETENLPAETKKFEEEEKPPMPDMSDPNKPMSPDDIAALIANM